MVYKLLADGRRIAISMGRPCGVLVLTRRGGLAMSGLAQDLRYTLRQLRKSPGFTVAAVLTLAMAIGANAVVFGVMNGLILRPLNVPQAESLYAIEHGSG